MNRLFFVTGRRGAVVEVDFYDKLERLSVQTREKDKILTAHVHVHSNPILSANTWVVSPGADVMTLMETIGEQVFV